MRQTIDYPAHGQTMGELSTFFPGVTDDQVAGGAGFAAAETVTSSTRNGTHLDAVALPPDGEGCAL